MKYPNLRVVFDLDDVGRLFMHKTIEVYHRVHPNFKYPKFEDVINFDMNNFFDERADVREFAFELKVEEIFEEAPIEEGFKETLDFVKSLGHTVIIATHNDGQRALSTLKWLAKHEIQFDELYFTGDKYKAKGDIYFDDAVHNLNNILDNTEFERRPATPEKLIPYTDYNGKPQTYPSNYDEHIILPILYAYDKPWNQNWTGRWVYNMQDIQRIFREESF